MTDTGNVSVDVNLPEPEPGPTLEPEPVPVPVPVPEPVVIPAPTSTTSDAYVSEHGRTHEGLEERIRECEEKLEIHSGRHDSHVSGLEQAHSRIDEIVERLNESTPTETAPTETEPTIITPDIPAPENTERRKHTLRKFGF